MTFSIPALPVNVDWSIAVRELKSGKYLLAYDENRLLRTASIGKIFLLIALAEAETQGRLSYDDRLIIPDAHRVADSGILYLMRDQQITLYDAALLVGAASDNLATNALIHLLGLENVRDISHRLGFTSTELHDYIRDERTPDVPWTPSFGTAAELSQVMKLLHDEQVFTPEISQQVLTWLAANTDTSMLADSFALDPLAHIDAEYQGMVLRHKTGSTDEIRVDTGLIIGPAGAVAYSVGANWIDSRIDYRVPVIDAMRSIGEQIRAYVTGLDRADWNLM